MSRTTYRLSSITDTSETSGAKLSEKDLTSVITVRPVFYCQFQHHHHGALPFQPHPFTLQWQYPRVDGMDDDRSYLDGGAAGSSISTSLLSW
jgi:hypothetical protein